MTSFPVKHLTVGGEDPFLPSLLQAINHATSISIAAAFIRQTGLNLIFTALEDALLRGAKIRILTGDYMGITEPKALRHLLLLQTRGAEIKVFESKAKKSFHMKAYIFLENANDQLDGCAFIGSSNISKAALLDGLEWNVSVDLKAEPKKFNTILVKYEELYSGAGCVHLNHEWIDAYEKRIPKTLPVKLISNTDDEDFEPTPEPNIIQQQALTALHRTRLDGYQRGLVVMATGTGKTWLSAFDSLNLNAKRILFVAHREEILDQAENTFIRMYPNSRIGRYSGNEKQPDVDLLFASIQTLGKKQHLEVFSSTSFDYVVVDEFHHAAASSYQKLLAYFTPKFMLGLTATPERTDQSDILSLCDDNLVFDFGLFDGIKSEILCPFDYQGIADTVDYTEISWRNGKFDPEQLENKLATISRANHNLKHWQKHKRSRTLGFCVSTQHADFMAKYFTEKGIKAVSVHSKSSIPRNVALSQLSDGVIDIIFSVDLFNEGVDLPSIDTVMMLRPTDSKIVFLQQLGRGLRKSIETGKDRLVILDFIGNHISFFRKVDSLFKFGTTNKARRSFLSKVQNGSLTIPKNCFVNFELTAINILEKLLDPGPGPGPIDEIYNGLIESLDRRPTLSEFFHAGGSVAKVRNEHGCWFEFVNEKQDLDNWEKLAFDNFQGFLSEVETTSLNKSFKLVLLEAFLELDGFSNPVELPILAVKSLSIFKRRRPLLQDLPLEFRDLSDSENINDSKWIKYWKTNPVNAWVGGNKKTGEAFFKLENNLFEASFSLPSNLSDAFSKMLQELVNYRFLQYEARIASKATNPEMDLTNVTTFNSVPKQSIPYFRDLKIACGHFKSSEHELSEMIDVPEHYGKLDPSRHFVANASGNSMNGGIHPIKHADLLLLEKMTPEQAGSISGKTVVIERQGATGDDQYLLRNVKKISDQQYKLIAQNTKYESMDADEDMKTLAFLKSVIDPADVYAHKEFMREDIPPIFGLEFNKGAWEAGHVRPKASDDQFLLVTLNKQGKAIEQQYKDYFVDQNTFHWQSQASTRSNSAKGNALQQDKNVHLFVRKNKLSGGKAAPFYYLGKLDYQSHNGEMPMSVTWKLQTPLPSELLDYFQK